MIGSLQTHYYFTSFDLSVILIIKGLAMLEIRCMFHKNHYISNISFEMSGSISKYFVESYVKSRKDTKFPSNIWISKNARYEEYIKNFWNMLDIISKIKAHLLNISYQLKYDSCGFVTSPSLIMLLMHIFTFSLKNLSSFCLLFFQEFQTDKVNSFSNKLYHLHWMYRVKKSGRQ